MQVYKVTVEENGKICWYDENNRLHRLDGPAVVNSDRTEEYWINGTQLTKKNFDNYNKKEMTVAEIEKELGYSIKIVK
jgi:hypothetical protein